jgi:hypothetical protein
MVTATELSENSRQGFGAQKPTCIGLETGLSRNSRWGCGHIYDETPVDIAVYVRNDPVNLVDPDGRYISPFSGGVFFLGNWAGVSPFLGLGWWDLGASIPMVVNQTLRFFGANLGQLQAAAQAAAEAAAAQAKALAAYRRQVQLSTFESQIVGNQGMSDCEKLARMAHYATTIWNSGIDVARGLLAGLTEYSNFSLFGNSPSDSNLRVGVMASDPNYNGGFGDTGFNSAYQDSSNQVRHFVGFFAMGNLLGAAANVGLLINEGTLDPNNPDVALGQAAISMGATLANGDNLKNLGQNIWHQICGQNTDLAW